MSSVIRAVLSVILAPLLLSGVAGGATYQAAGASLGLFIGGLLFVTLLVPPLTMAETVSARRVGVALLVTLPWCAIWLMTIPKAEVRVIEWLGCCLVLVAYAVALGAVAALIARVGASAIVASAVSVTVGLAWMTWPIWLSPTWNGDRSEGWVAKLVVCHPGFAINGRLVRGTLGSWTEQSVAYHLTDLNQTVVYTLPMGIWPSLLLHGLLGAAVFGWMIASERRRAVPMADDTATVTA